MIGKNLQLFLFNKLIGFSSYIARKESLSFLTKITMQAFGKLVLIVNGGKPKTSVLEVGQEWQRMFPNKKLLPITKVENDTVYAEIKVKCPLRGSGDVNACYKMMEYDRELLGKIGGKLVVLRSQAEPGVEVCQLAIRSINESMDDLTPAHKRQ